MSAPLPLHVATADEPIPPPSARPLTCEPDMRKLTPLEEMLAELAHVGDDDAEFVALFMVYVAEIGCTLTAHYDRAGELGLSLGSPCDPQIRHRSRWMHFLAGRLDAVPARRDLLLRVLIDAGRCWDERKPEPREVMGAVRQYIATGGRVLLDPEGNLGVGGGLGFPADSSDEVYDAARRASRAYHAVRGRPGASRLIRRALRMRGRPHNGWLILEGARS